MQIGIALRLALVLAVFAVLASGLTGYYAYHTTRQQLVVRAEQSLLTATQVLGQRFLVALSHGAKDARLLASLAREGASEDSLAQMGQAMLKAHPEYFQMRLIDGRQYGLERVRLDRDGKRITRVRGAELQEKSHELYVSDGLRLTEGQVYLSRMFINREAGAHAGFERPTLIMASPVVNGGGVAEQLAVINIDLETLFQDMQVDLPPGFGIYLTNEWGDFLMHPDSSQVFGFERGMRILLQDSFPAAQSIITGAMDSVVVNTEEQAADHGAYRDFLAAFHKLQPQEFASPRFFILGLSEPLDYVLQDTRVLGWDILRIVLLFSLLALLLAWVVSRAVTRPLAGILRAVKAFSSSPVPQSLPVQRKDEVGVLARGVAEMQQQICCQLDALEDNRKALSYLAHNDALTGLPNRVTFFDRLEMAITLARRQGGKLGILFVDLDRFKEVNDQFGHRTGDLLLQAVAQRLQGAVRESDTAARLSGDEFVVLLNPVRSAEEAESVAAKLLRRFQGPLELESIALHIHVSIGISLFPDHGEDAQSLVEAADEAMYRSKSAGRNTYSMAGKG